MLPDEILRLASRHPAGLFSNRQAARAGFGSWRLTEWVRSGLLERLTRGWYRVAGHPVPPLQHLHLAQDYLGRRQRNCATQHGGRPQALLTGAGAVLGYGVEIPSGRPTMLIDVDRRVRLQDAPFEVLRCEMAREVGVTRRRLLLTDAARAVGDYAGTHVTDREVRVVVDGLRIRASMDIVDAVRSWSRRRGAGFRRLMDMAVGGAFLQESEGERRFFREVFLRGGPVPDCQVWLTPRIRVDFAFLSAGLTIEYHGEDAHRDRVDADAVRALEVRRLGHDQLVVTKGMLDDPVGLWRYIHELRRRGEDDITRGHRPPPTPPLRRPRLRPLLTIPGGGIVLTEPLAA